VGGQVEGERVSRREAVRTGEVCSEASGLWDRCSSRDLGKNSGFFSPSYTDKKENQIFLIYKEIQSGAVAKAYMR
jgi:hypothetical protein